MTTTEAPLLDGDTSTPARRPGSVRRTSTVLMSWPDGVGSGLHLRGRCRDLVTSGPGACRVFANADLDANAGSERDITSLVSDPPTPGLDRLVGSRAGGRLRGAIARELPDEADRGTPLHLLLDDLAGSTLIAGFVVFRWADHLPELQQRRRQAPRRVMEGICSGFRPGATSLQGDGTQSGTAHHVTRAASLGNIDDPMGWHPFDDHPAMAMRRARRIDVWPEGDEFGIDAMFRDSCWDPDGAEVAVHEYRIYATAAQASTVLTSVTAVPRTLPYLECPLAAPNASRLVGTPLRALRSQVLERLRGTDCCTHLNDALRALADVPVLAAALPST